MPGVKISNLPTASTLDGTEQLAIVQSSATKVATLNSVKGLTTTATEAAEGIVEFATSAEVEAGFSSAADKVVRSNHLRLKVEGGSIILKGTSDPTSGGANTGVDSVISGKSNSTNSGKYCAIFGELNSKTGTDKQEGDHCLISGKNNYNNSGDQCLITGQGNHSNAGNYCIISGRNNTQNSGAHTSISGYNNPLNTGNHSSISGAYQTSNSGSYSLITGSTHSRNAGDHCIISGLSNQENTGSFSSISGQYNTGNFGTHSIIGGKIASGTTKVITSGATATASTNLINKTGHGVTVNQPLRFTTLTGGTGLSTSTTYYARDILTNTFAVALSPGGSAVSITGDYTVANFIANGVNYGNFTLIAGEDNKGNSGSHCLVGGEDNINNSGNLCLISGSNNYSNTGIGCSIGGKGNYSNSGNYTLISGKGNHTNAGNFCSISGYNNHSNLGSNCSISGNSNYSNNSGDTFITGTGNHTNSGSYCSIAGNGNRNNSGYNCLISGEDNHSNSGYACTITGKGNYSNSGNYTTISGFYNHSNSGSYSLITGRNAPSNALSHARVHGGNTNARIIDLVAQIDSSGTGATELLIGGAGGERIIIPDQSAWACEVHFVAKTATGANASMQRVDGLIVRDGTSTTYAAGVADTQVNIGTSNASFVVSGDDTNEALKLTVAASSGTVRCVARITLTQVDF